MIKPAKKNGIVSTLYWHIVRFEVLMGIAILAAASAIFALALRRNVVEEGNPARSALNHRACLVPVEAD